MPRRQAATAKAALANVRTAAGSAKSISAAASRAGDSENRVRRDAGRRGRRAATARRPRRRGQVTDDEHADGGQFSGAVVPPRADTEGQTVAREHAAVATVTPSIAISCPRLVPCGWSSSVP